MPARVLRLSVGIGTALLLAGLAAATLLLVGRMERSAASVAADTVERAARAAEATVNRQFVAVDGMLAGLPPLLGSLIRDDPGDAGRVGRVLRDLTAQNFNFRNLLLVRPDGIVWAAGLPDSRRRPLPVPAEALAAVPGSGAVSIIGPVLNPGTGEWTLFFARDITVPELGRTLAVAEVPVPQVAAMLAPIGDVPGQRITVERRDGTLLASVPHDEGAIGRSMAQPLKDPETDGIARMGMARLAAVPAVTAARPTLYRDVLVTVGWRQSSFEADMAGDRQGLLMGATGAGLLLLALAFALDLALRQRERVEAERTAARKTLENAIEALPDGFVMFDAADRLVISNRRYREIYAVTGDYIRAGATFESLVRGGIANGQYPQAGDDREAFIAGLLEWHRGDHPPLERLLPGDHWILATERRTPDGGTVGVRTDISALKRANAEITAARDAAAAATRAKSLFLARMSHELRTPLNGVLGLAQALAADPALSPEARGRAETLEAAGRHLVNVANDLLDLARAEEGQLALHPTAFELRPVLTEALTLIRPAASAASVELRTEFAGDLPPMVRADATRLRQLLLNLLSNAVKFTPPEGWVALRAWRTGGDADVARIRFEVRDTGPGVPEAARQAIFGDFVQVAGGHARGGAGLGLAIAAQIAERMGGQIGCDTAGPQGGALFWVELPLATVAAVAPAAVVPAQPTKAAARALSILVVDDVASNLAVARALLGSAGHEVVCVDSGSEALQLLQQPGDGPLFDAVLMDLMMPGMDGLETTRRLRALPGRVGKLPILAVTASAFPEDIVACREAGMDGHLAKPIERAALLEALDRLLSREATDAPPLLERTAPPGLAIPGLDAAAADRLHASFVAEIASAGAALREAPAADPAAIAAAAHRLAGAAATLGAARLASLSRRLESEIRRPAGADRDALRQQAIETARLTLAELRGEARVAA